jgi:catechol 2,3-dioxygenase-like lactoylglutathione lyase family enzyme
MGSPLNMAILSVENVEGSLRFYRDLIGLDPSEVVALEGPTFESYWHLPTGSKAQAVLLSAGTSEVGRILLLQFEPKAKWRVREHAERRFIGLFNLNFYTHDIRAAARMMASHGYRLWSEPVHYELSATAGSPTEMLFEGPDGGIINLVELAGGDETTRIGQMRRFLEEQGTTRTGFTPVVTSAHCVRSREAALAFYQDVLGMEILIDEVLDKPESNRFLSLDSDARTRVTFLKGDHLFGKVVITQPLNYEPPDFVPVAVAPNIGYLAMSFNVPDLVAAEAACQRTGAQTYSPVTEINLPGIGLRQAMMVRTPGSGALTQLVEAV